jgi:glucan biosynthesis protein C
MDVLPLRTVAPDQAKTRIAGFDVVRALAVLGVVALHACVPYLRNPMPGLSWSVTDRPDALVDFAFWTIEVFIMPLFLAQAGYFAWQTLSHRGPSVLVKSRAKRLLIPLTFGCLVILPIDLHVWVLGWVADGLVEPVKLRSFKFDGDIDRNLWGTCHLWFLQYLFLYAALLAGWRTAEQKSRLLGRIRASAGTVALTLFAIAFVTLLVRPNVVWGFQHAFAPVPSKWIYSGVFFFAGALLASADPQLRRLQSTAGRLTASASLLLIAAVTMGRWHLAGGDGAVANSALALLTVAAAAAATFGLLGLATRLTHTVPTAIRYLAAASFWVYLVHHPIVVLVQQDLKWLLPAASPILKAVLSTGLTTVVSLLTYETLVRRTWLGRLLGFSWMMPPPPPLSQENSASESPGRGDAPLEIPGRRAA